MAEPLEEKERKATLVHQLVLGRALGGEGEEGDLGLLADKGTEGAGRRQGDVDHLLGGRAGVDGAVGEAEHVVAGGGGFAQAHEEGGGGQLDARGRAHALEGRAEHVAGRGDGAGHEAVGLAGGEHHGAEVDTLVEQGLAGAFGGHAFGLALLVEGLGEFVEQRALGVVDHLRGGHQLHAGGVFGEGDLLGRAQDDDVGDVLLHCSARLAALMTRGSWPSGRTMVRPEPLAFAQICFNSSMT